MKETTKMTLEDLLRTKVPMSKDTHNVHGNDSMKVTPDFRVAVQEQTKKGVRIIIHPNGHNGATLDYWVVGDQLTAID